MCVYSCVSRMVIVSKPSTDKRVEKTKEMRMTVSTRKLLQKTPATIINEKKDLSSSEVGEAHEIMNIAKERDMDLKQKRAHNVLPACPLFDSDLLAHANDPNLRPIVLQPHVFGGMGRRLAVTTRICLYRWKVREFPCNVSHEQPTQHAIIACCVFPPSTSTV